MWFRVAGTMSELTSMENKAISFGDMNKYSFNEFVQWAATCNHYSTLNAVDNFIKFKEKQNDKHS